MPGAAPRLCSRCQASRAVLKRPKNHDQLCKECFYYVFEEEVHECITRLQLFKRGERVALAASGGKDSTVLAHVVTTLNKRYDYGLDLFLLSIDEGIAGYRDDSLDTVRRNEATYGIPLVVVSYKQLYGWTMDDIVAQIGTKNNCTFCGVFRRQALDRGAVLARADKIATGHNADDVAETVLLNILRGDVPRLSRCASAVTGGDEGGGLPRVKPFKYSYEKEIVMYAYFKRLDYFSTECVYAPFAARGFARDFVKDLEAARPSAILDLIRSAENFRFVGASTLSGGGNSNAAPASAPANGSTAAAPVLTPAAQSHAVAVAVATARGQQPRACERCGYLASQPVCKACVLLEGLNKGRPGGVAPFAELRRPPTDMTFRSRSWETEQQQQQQQQGAGQAASATPDGPGTSNGADQASGTTAAAEPAPRKPTGSRARQIDIAYEGAG